MPLAFPHHDDSVLRARNSAANKNQIAVTVHLNHLEMLDGDLLVTILTSHALARENTTRIRVSGKTTRFTHIVSAVTTGTAVEIVALDRTGKTVTFGNTRDVNHFHFGEIRSSEFLANRPIFKIFHVKFSEVTTNVEVSLFEMSNGRLVGTRFLD